jgi:hypothetical protein
MNNLKQQYEEGLDNLEESCKSFSMVACTMFI